MFARLRKAKEPPRALSRTPWQKCFVPPQFVLAANSYFQECLGKEFRINSYFQECLGKEFRNSPMKNQIQQATGKPPNSGCCGRGKIATIPGFFHRKLQLRGPQGDRCARAGPFGARRLQSWHAIKYDS